MLRHVAIKARAICTATEAEEKVLRAVMRALGIDGESLPEVRWSRVSGTHGDPLAIVEVKIEGELALRAAKHLAEALPSSYLKEGLYSSGQGYTLHIRLDKQLAYSGLIAPSERDAIKIEIRSSVNPLLIIGEDER